MRIERGAPAGVTYKAPGTSADVNPTSTPTPGPPERYGLLFLEVPEPVLLVRLADLQILDVNQAASERFGYSREAYLRMRLTDFHLESDGARIRQALFQEALSKNHEPSTGLSGYKTRTAAGETINTDFSVRLLTAL